MAIRRLDSTTVNRIAAGEVIERPAAALKELVENAIDARAHRIEIAVFDGGITRIDVRDDGVGIPEKELALAIERHATSKLDDSTLVRITTLGFRGEALPSIGAVAHLSLTSRPRGQDVAARIRVAGGAIGTVEPAAAPFGTRAVVEDLFFATPARRKFLRSVRAESSACAEIARRLALAAPQISFTLTVDGIVEFDLPSQDRTARLSGLFGKENSQNLLPIRAEHGDLRLTGFVSPAELTRSTARHVHLIVNDRPVHDQLLRLALRLAYRDTIPAGRHPLAALWLELPHRQLDVNVHPAKAELRFADADSVRALVIKTVREAVATPISQRNIPLPSVQPRYFMPPSHRAPSGEESQSRFDLGAPAIRRLHGNAPVDREAMHHFPLGAPIAQIFNTYILALASEDTLVLIDQHAAHERLTQERMRDERAGSGITPQALLSPIPVDLPAADVRRLLAAADSLRDLGLEIEGFGPGAIMVRTMPTVLGDADPTVLVRDVADTLNEYGDSTALSDRLDAVLTRMACHHSIRAGRRLSHAEMSALLRAMEATPRSQTCPHGRPTVLRLTRSDLDRMFGRTK